MRTKPTGGRKKGGPKLSDEQWAKLERESLRYGPRTSFSMLDAAHANGINAMARAGVTGARRAKGKKK